MTECNISMNGELKLNTICLWENTPDTFPERLELSEPTQRRANDAIMNTIADEAIKLVKGYTGIKIEDTGHLGAAFKKLTYNCGTKIVGLKNSSMELLLEQGLYEVTLEFISKATGFDKDMNLDDILQALRNVWIMNIIQKLINVKVELTPSIFAYSMLYPYTDNYLDSVSFSKKNKDLLNIKVEKMLTGEKCKPETEFERKLFRLVGMIEGQYPRNEYPNVYRSLLDIHKAQGKSLKQQMNDFRGTASGILEVSAEKGGASVLADACLLKGSLSYQEAAFMYGFGLMLQLLDDLQDTKIDKRNGFNTVFSNPNSQASAQSYTNRLVNFIYKVLDDDTCFISGDAIEIKTLIKKSMTFLILTAVASNRALYPREYLNRLESLSPLSFASMRKLYKRAGKEYSKLKIKLVGW